MSLNAIKYYVYYKSLSRIMENYSQVYLNMIYLLWSFICRSEMVSLISVHGRGSLSNVYGLLQFFFLPVGFTGQYFSVLHGHWVSCAPAMISYSCLFVQVCVFFEYVTECSLGFTYVCVAAVDVTRDVTDGSTLVFFVCFIFRVNYHRADGVRRRVVHVYVM